MTVVLDATALLAFLGGEPGADAVEAAFDDATACSTVNWSDVAQKVRANGGDWSLAAALLTSYGLVPIDATAQDAESAAALWVRGSGLSLADRFCLALAARLEVPALTADAAWETRTASVRSAEDQVIGPHGHCTPERLRTDQSTVRDCPRA